MPPIRSIITFRSMITPYIVQLFFWISVITLITVGTRNILGHGSIIANSLAVVLGIGVSRVICECLIVIFRINDTLQYTYRKLK